jgi:hypothetical protein
MQFHAGEMGKNLLTFLAPNPMWNASGFIANNQFYKHRLRNTTFKKLQHSTINFHDLRNA